MIPGQRPSRVDIWHNILWSRYKGEVFSALHQIADPGTIDVRFMQIAETEGARVGLAGVDLSYHRYPYRLMFSGGLDGVPFLARLGKLSWFALATDADLVLLAGYEKPEYWAQLLILKLRGKKAAVFCDSTINDQRQRLVKGVLKRVFFGLVNAIFCYGTRSMEYVAHYGASPDKIFKRCQAAAIPHDYSPERAHADRMSLAAPPEVPRFLYVGRFSPEKDLETLIRAFAATRRDLPTSRLVLVGSGPLEARLRAVVAATALEAAVEFVGSKSGVELFEEYSRATCLILPSYSEPWGLVVNEALAFGCPAIVSSHCGCAPELIAEGVTGYVYPAGDTDALAQRMIAAVADFADRDATAAACLEQIAEFSPRAAAGQILFGLQSTLAATMRP